MIIYQLLYSISKISSYYRFFFIFNNTGNLNMNLTLSLLAIIVTFFTLVSIAKLEKNNVTGIGSIKSYREFIFIKSNPEF